MPETPQRPERVTPERIVVRTGVSPMNPRVKWAELSCGHDVFMLRRPRVGSRVACDKCQEAEAR